MAQNEEPLARIAAALERLAPAPPPPALREGRWFAWRARDKAIASVAAPSGPPLTLLLGVESQRDALLGVLRRFAEGQPANNALLWGARGTGKSALVRATAAAVMAEGGDIAVLELPTHAVGDAPLVIEALAETDRRIVLLLDDLSFDPGDAAVRALKPALDGSLLSAAGRLLVCATSNRRHLAAPAPAPGASPHDPSRLDAEQDRLALSDRFGLSLAFHAIDQDNYLAIVGTYVGHFGLEVDRDTLRAEALEWAMTRGARSGRTAWQFVLDLGARLNRPVTFTG